MLVQVLQQPGLDLQGHPAPARAQARRDAPGADRVLPAAEEGEVAPVGRAGRRHERELRGDVTESARAHSYFYVRRFRNKVRVGCSSLAVSKCLIDTTCV